MAGIASRAEQLLGISVISTTPVAGGDICTSTRLRLSDGRSAVAKTRPKPPRGFFASEAAGLRWLGETEGADVPDVLGVSDDCLLIAWVEPGRATPEAAYEFGQQLSRTHAAGADEFGGSENGYIGLLPLPNNPAPTWPEFYATRRVLPYLKLAHDRGAITDDEIQPITTLARRIDEFAGPTEPPSRIHGDLWSGNLVWGADGDVHIIDPAAHGGHRETDIAMLSLFGAPHLQRIIEGYEEVSPLADGWRARLPLHQLHPLLVHAALFGGGYGARASSAAQSVLDGTSGRD